MHGMLYSAQTFEYLVRALESASPASCKTPATSIDSICPNKHPRRNRKFWKKKKKKSNFQQIILYCLGLCTENLGLREVDLEPSLNRGSDKINRLRPRKRTQHKMSGIVQPRLANENPALRQVDLEPSAKKGTDRTKAWVSFYWLSQSLPLKQSFNRVLNKSTFGNPIKRSWPWKEIDQIPKLHALQHIKINFPKTSINGYECGYKRLLSIFVTGCVNQKF